MVMWKCLFSCHGCVPVPLGEELEAEEVWVAAVAGEEGLGVVADVALLAVEVQVTQVVQHQHGGSGSH